MFVVIIKYIVTFLLTFNELCHHEKLGCDASGAVNTETE